MAFIIANRDCFWPELKVPFEIPEHIFPIGSKSRNNIVAAIKVINAKTNVQLFDRKGRTDIVDYVEYRLSDTEETGNICNSPVGRQGGRQLVHCDANRARTVVHETCHALGLRHEQQRPDRDDFIKVDLSKKPPGLSVSNYEIRNDLMFGPYDLRSIMQYSGAEISSKTPGATIGGNTLSGGDIAALNAMGGAGFLSMEDDASSDSTIYVQSVEGTVAVKKGEFKKIIVPSNRFFWYSGDSREWTTASPSTNLIWVYRKRDGREILWFCYNDPKVVRGNWRFLGDEHDQCSATNLRVFGKTTVKVQKGETKMVRLGSHKFEWRCGDSNESTVAPEGTNVVFVTRARAGRAITWACYRFLK